MMLGRRLNAGALRIFSLVIGTWLGMAGLEASVAAAQECPFGFPVDCGTYCCESGGTCYNGGCNAPSNDPAPSSDSCPAAYPIDCGTYCCESGGTCYDGGCNGPSVSEDPGGYCPDA